ncbi:hypothetical protein [Paenibacillus sp. N3.4]|uniref:hypothetical protein n=1 Tax=Paenibacillus sp. N3.4 TaxID=2603222 RepID=UPI0011C8757C|nr:hypothetical protein [Paenibacillus sp. N3.4]TXK83442.1 hypothetical protein FU659_13715 [Paenibacillus sp. N3.4]
MKDRKLEELAVRYLKKRKHPIALFLLGEITKQDLLNGVCSQPIMAIRDSCKYEFWIAVKNLKDGDEQGYIEHLEQCKEFQGRYLEFEYYLALRELERLKVLYEQN